MKLDDGLVLASPKKVHEGIVKHFQNFIAKTIARENLDIEHLLPKIITKEENAHFMVRPIEDEPKENVKSILIDSSPGPDVLGSLFFSFAGSS